MKLAHLHRKSTQLNEPMWHIQLAVLVAIALQLSVNSGVSFGPKYAVAGFEILLLGALFFIKPGGRAVPLRRTIAIVLIALVSAVNIGSLVIILDNLFNGSGISGHQLILAAVTIYLTNIIMFGPWYWEMDNSGDRGRDFLFPQMATSADNTRQPSWQPAFFDYLYVSITNASAFSPTDTAPLTQRAKLLMTSQSMVSLVTVVLVTARAVSVLS